MIERHPYTTSAGHRPHRTRPVTVHDEDEKPRVDHVPIIERYTDVAAQMHRTVSAPRGDRWILGCICGWYALTPTGLSGMAASLRCQQHVLDNAQSMMRQLEPKDPDTAQEPE